MSDKNIDKDIEILKNMLEKEQWCLNYYVDQDEVQAIENVLKQLKEEKEGRETLSKLHKEIFEELETYKKIVEKLAEILSDFDFDKMCESCNSCIGNGCTAYEDIDEYKECIIDWARKEVEKDV